MYDSLTWKKINADCRHDFIGADQSNGQNGHIEILRHYKCNSFEAAQTIVILARAFRKNDERRTGWQVIPYAIKPLNSRIRNSSVDRNMAHSGITAPFAPNLLQTTGRWPSLIAVEAAATAFKISADNCLPP